MDSRIGMESRIRMDSRIENKIKIKEIKTKIKGFQITDLTYDSHSTEDIIKTFQKIWNQNPKLALHQLFQLRQQFGQKLVFRILCFYLKLADNYVYKQILIHIPFIGTWKDVLWISELTKRYNTNLSIQSEIEVFKRGIELNNIYCAKWAPSENSHYDKTIQFAHLLMSALNITPKVYRKRLSHLRKRLDLIETQLSQQQHIQNPLTISTEAYNQYQNALERRSVNNIQFSPYKPMYPHPDIDTIFPKTHIFNQELADDIEKAALDTMTNIPMLK